MFSTDSMKQVFLLCVLAAFAGALAGCGNAEPQSSYKTSDGERVSTIPWNKPQQWESAGALGSALGH
jgi:hypothetical protein